MSKAYPGDPVVKTIPQAHGIIKIHKSGAASFQSKTYGTNKPGGKFRYKTQGSKKK